MRFPADIREHLLAQEWNHRIHFRNRVLHERVEASLPLKPPTGDAAAQDIGSFRRFLDAWAAVRPASLVRWEERTLRGIGDVRVPTHVFFPSTLAVAEFIGQEAIERLRHLQARLKPFNAVSSELRQAAARAIHDIEPLPVVVCEMLASAMAQMRAGMGTGLYLRALPLEGVHTKLVERHRPLIESVMNRWRDGEIADAGGLLSWLDCLVKGADRLMLRPLSVPLRASLWGLDQIWISSESLASIVIPAQRILIVENDVSGLALPDLPYTVAIIGCGNNLAWLDAPWLVGKRVGYWGDLDTWGLQLLARARRQVPHLEPLMMDVATWEAHPEAIVIESEPCERPPEGLTGFEWALFDRIRGVGAAAKRLEQEKLRSDYAIAGLTAWALSH